MCKVFISYSRGSQEHEEQVLGLSEKLRADGVDSEIALYEESPAEGWLQWIRRQIEDRADFVLVVCTETYNQLFLDEEKLSDPKKDVWEFLIIMSNMYKNHGHNTKFIPIVFREEDLRFIPAPLNNYTHYSLGNSDGYDNLYRRLTNQPNVVRGELGTAEIMPPQSVTTPPEMGNSASTAAQKPSQNSHSIPLSARDLVVLLGGIEDDDFRNLCQDFFPTVFSEFVRSPKMCLLSRKRLLVHHVLEHKCELSDLITGVVNISESAREYLEKKSVRLSGNAYLNTLILVRREEFTVRAILSIISIFLLVLLSRYLGLGIVKTMETKAYDLVLANRFSSEVVDSPIVVVTIDKEDADVNNRSLSAGKIKSSLEKISKLNPAVVGVGIMLGDPSRKDKDLNDYDTLVKHVKEINVSHRDKQIPSRVILACRGFGINGGDADSIEIPKESSTNYVGFTDSMTEQEFNEDKTFRRNFLFRTPIETDKCKTDYSFSLRTSLEYLSLKQNCKVDLVEEGETKDKLSFKCKNANSSLAKSVSILTKDSPGFYHWENQDGNYFSPWSILLNYRHVGIGKNDRDAFKEIPLKQVNSNDIKKSDFEGRIVLVGYSFNDPVTTPYSKELPAIFLEAHRINQIVEYVTSGRALIHPLSFGLEITIIFFSGSLSTLITFITFRRKQTLTRKQKRIEISIKIFFTSCLTVFVYAFLLNCSLVNSSLILLPGIQILSIVVIAPLLTRSRCTQKAYVYCAQILPMHHLDNTE